MDNELEKSLCAGISISKKHSSFTFKPKPKF